MSDPLPPGPSPAQPSGLPELDPAARAQAVAAASAARARRARVKSDLKGGRVSLPDVLAAAEGDRVLARMPVVELLEALPRIGPVRAAELMEVVGIAANRRVGGLGAIQRAALLRELR